MIKIGVISDTHGHLDPHVMKAFAGVNHILHAGDIGLPWLLLELESLAPVTAVLGNNDEGLSYNETEVVQLGGRTILVHHIVNPHALEEKIKRRIVQHNPDVVIFGHTHQRFCETVHQRLYFNPGYAGKPRLGQERSVAILTLDDRGITADFLELPIPQ